MYLNAIQNFLTPKNITDVWSWFGLVNQVANYEQLCNVLVPFKLFLSLKRKFQWSDVLDKAFVTVLSTANKHLSQC